MNDGAQVKLLSRHKRKTVLKVKAHLTAEDRARAGSRAIAFVDAMEKDMTHQIFILMFNKHDQSIRKT